MKTFCALCTLALASAAFDKLVTFDGVKKTSFDWHETNDPVMGGQSSATFAVKDGMGIFNGTCRIVPKLGAPGFCNAQTEKKMGRFLVDVSSHIEESLLLSVRTTTPEFKGFKVAFGAKDVPKTSIFGGQSFKAGFNVTASKEFQIVEVPFNTFSYDWSGFTGRCDTKDPNGQQHHCCSKESPKYCPTAKFLGEITDIELWAEGAEGNFHLEVEWIGAGSKASVNGAGKVMLATFDGNPKTNWNWKETDDPVMGGQSKGSFTVKNGAAVFAGTCKIVPFLKAPGFCKATTSTGLLKKFPDASAFIDGGAMYLTARTTTPEYAGYRLAFAAKNISSHTQRHGPGSFKAHFSVPAGKGWQTVRIPFTDFSSDWSDYTGECDSKDPNGQQHHCCSKDHPDVCATASNLRQITDLEVWAEGKEGNFDLEIQSIAAGY